VQSESGKMPALGFLAIVGLALIALLFTSQRYGLPEPGNLDAIQTLTTAQSPKPNRTSQAVLAAQPNSAPEALAQIGSVARAARAESRLKDKRVTQPIHYQQTSLFDRFSIKGY